ncbi:MAG TPA: HPF/RaiA family ribosome-associated protein [Planctomycetota bacterium]|nr:HPF/RaiA family ribosome-associated protein [Planctomycetota bacterium]
MQVPLQISFDGMPESDDVRRDIETWASQLEQYHDRITACHVVVSAPHRHARQGRRYSVRIRITVPGRELVVDREHRDSPAHEDVFIAVRDAFHAARRQLQDAARLHRRQVKVHETPPHGRIARLFADEGYGFIETPDGRELYFHRNGVLDPGFDELAVGTEVRFHESAGDKGPCASSVRPVGAHHHLA